MNYSLTDTDIKRIVGDHVPVIPYSELIKNGVLNVLMSCPDHCCIFLVRQSEHVGHWCLCFLKTKGSEIGIHIYDPYGNPPDGDDWTKRVANNVLHQLHQEKPYLLKELYNSGYKIYFNEYEHQNRDDSIQTCGRHCCVRASFLDLDTNQYNKQLNMIAKKNGLSTDELVCELTNSFLN
jgi:hypothetical protein